MANIENQHSVKLNNRTLWFDGTSTVPSKDIVDAIVSGLPTAGLHVDELTDEIRQFNSFSADNKKITIKEKLNPLSFDWDIPNEYLTLDVEEYLFNDMMPETLTDAETLLRIQRVQEELELYTQLNLLPILRVLIYIINTLNAKGVMWGVGRGSSVASYVLYLIGVHDIDSVKHELDITDFLRLES